MKQEKTMKSSRKLKDYPPIPSTPPPSDKKDRGLIHLEEELEHERKYLGALCMENKELEEILQNFDKEISYIKSNFPQQIVGDGKIHANNEFWFKYESQIESNRKLEREKKHLLSEIKQIEEQGLINLDSLSQSELILYVKQLERTKTDLLSDLRSKEWGLDKQAKDIHHLNEIKKTLQAEIRHYDKEFAMYRHYKKNSCPSAGENRPTTLAEEKRLKMWRQKEKSKSTEQPDKTPDKHNSLSQEDIVNASKTDVMFSSLDESKLGRMEVESPTPGFQRRLVKGGISERKRIIDAKKGPIKKTVAISSLPELSGNRARTPSPRTTKAKRSKPENKVKKNKAVRMKGISFEKTASLRDVDDVETEVRKTNEKSEVITFEPSPGKKFIITVRIIVRMLPNASPCFTVDKEETTVIPL